MTPKKFISQLSPVKQRIATLLSEGFKPEQVATKVSKENGASVGNTKAWVTMVVNLAKKKKVSFSKPVSATEKKTVKVSAEPVTKTTKNYEISKEKEPVRAETVKEIKESSIKEGLILTLSADQCLTEKAIHAIKKGYKFLACEIDETVFSKLKKNIAEQELNYIRPILSPIGEIINLAAKDSFAHVILDYCKTIKEFGGEIQTAIKKRIVQKDGIIMVTLCQRAAGINTDDVLRNLVKQAGGKDYKIEYEKGYRDGAPMFTMIIRRIK